MTEIRIHRSLRHHRIVHFENCFEDRENIYMMLEVCPNQTLLEMVKRRRRIAEPEAQFFMLQILEGVRYLHENNVIHRDLKLGNLLLAEDMTIRIGDFGLAAQLDHPAERKRTVCGTPNYIAPEIIDKSSTGHSFQVDTWSLGVILYTLLVGRPPFETSDVHTTYRRIRENTYSFPETVPVADRAKDLIRAMLHPVPDSRPSLQQILYHPFFCHPGARIPLRLSTSCLTVLPHIDSRETCSGTSAVRSIWERPVGGLRGSSRAAGSGNGSGAAAAAGSGNGGGAAAAAAAVDRNPADDQENAAPVAAKGASSRASSRARSVQAFGGGKSERSGSVPRRALGERQVNRQEGFTAPDHSLKRSARAIEHAAGTGGGEVYASSGGRRGLSRGREGSSSRSSSTATRARPRKDEVTGEDNLAFQAPFTAHVPEAHAGLGTAPEPPSASAAGAAFSNGDGLRRHVTPRKTLLPPPPAPTAVAGAGNDAPVAGGDLPSAPEHPTQPHRTPSAGDGDGSAATAAMSASGSRRTARTPDTLQKMQRRLQKLQLEPGALEGEHGSASAAEPNAVPESPAANARVENPELWVSCWVDYTSKYGLGYLLSNGSVGVYFNDSTKMVLASDGSHVEYVERSRRGASGSREPDRQRMRLDSYPDALQKKITLLCHFRGYLLERFQKRTDLTEEERAAMGAGSPATDMPFVKKWVRTRHAVLFRLTNRTVQMNFFDHSSLVLSSDARNVTYVDKVGLRSHHPLNDVMDSGREDIAKRLRYTQDILHQVIAGTRH